MLEQWFSDPSKIGATVLLLTSSYAFWKGLVVPRWTYDAMEAAWKAQLQSAKEDCEVHRARNERLLAQMERAVSAAEATADVAANAVKKAQ